MRPRLEKRKPDEIKKRPPRTRHRLATEEATRHGATHEDIRRLAKLVRQQTYEENDTGDGETLMVPPDDQ